MDKGLYISMTGAREALLSQDTHANNLANASTTGFKADYQQYRSMQVFGSYYPSRVYAQTERPGTDMRGGNYMTTGRNLDVAVRGKGWIAVLDAEGKEAFTRAGDLERDLNGTLVTGSGLAVMGNDGPIVLPEYQKIEVGMDGSISVRALGEDALGMVEVNRIRLVNPDPKALEKGEDGLFRMRDGSEPEASAEVALANGMLESSNVNPVSELTSVITSSRLMELNVKMLATYKENDQVAARILQA
ncbi:Flagellar basal body rod protein [gamma proteobacterium HdN1]|nr:Flagellar basal body rod protein [gamma proteobacterium HdN1]